MAIGRRTIRSIAEATGFSVTTVSMVLRGRGAEFRISPATSERILRIAREMNYQPNLHARNLRSGGSNIVAIMVPTLTHRFFSGMVEAFERLARVNGRFPLIIATHHSPTEELDAVNYFISQNVDCVFAANTAALAEITAACERAELGLVVIDADGGTGHVVTTDNFAAARVLTERLLGRIGSEAGGGVFRFVGGSREHKVTRRRLEGFTTAFHARPDIDLQKSFVPAPFEGSLARDVFARLFAREPQITGIFVNSLAVMEGLLLYFRENRARCRSVSYAVFDYHPFMEAVDLDYVAVRQDAEAMMSIAFSLYLAGLDATAGRVHLAPYDLIESGPPLAT